jgi:hypothetical protein
VHNSSLNALRKLSLIVWQIEPNENNVILLSLCLPYPVPSNRHCNLGIITCGQTYMATLTPGSKMRFEELVGNQWIKSPYFVEHKYLLAFSPKNATGPHPGSNKPSPHWRCFINISINTTLTSTPRSPKWSLSFRFSSENVVYVKTSRPSHGYYNTCAVYRKILYLMTLGIFF